jgi:hypothetical protein
VAFVLDQGRVALSCLHFYDADLAFLVAHGSL